MRFQVFAILFFILVVSCNNPTEGNSSAETDATGPVLQKRIVPKADSAIIMSTADYEPQSQYESQMTASTAISLPSDYLVIAVKEYNLDMDEMDEQIVAYKIQSDDSDRIHVLVLDYDFVRGGYAVSWSAVTNSTNNRSVQISTADMTGDGSSEIILFGIDNHGRQTLNAYTAQSEITGQGLQFREIISISVDGTIDFEVPERSDDYFAAAAQSEPYRVSVQRQDDTSTSIMDLVQETHEWDAENRHYVITSTRDVPGMQVEESQLQELYSGGSQAFENFLKGPWYRSRGGRPDDSNAVLISFFPDRRELVFHSDDMQQIFDWELSSRTIYRNIRVDIRNRILPSISTFGSIAVIGLDTIRVQMQGQNTWDGEYRRVSTNLQYSLQEQSKGATMTRRQELSGLFRSDSGVELLLEGSRFSLTTEEESYNGGYSLYAFRDTLIMELQTTSSLGIPRDRFTYSVRIESEETSDRIIRTLSLSPVRLSAQSIVPEQDGIIQLEQIIEKAQD